MYFSFNFNFITRLTTGHHSDVSFIIILSFVNMKMFFITAFIRLVIWFVKCNKTENKPVPLLLKPIFHVSIPVQLHYQTIFTSGTLEYATGWWILSLSKWQEMRAFQDFGFKNKFQDSSVQSVGYESSIRCSCGKMLSNPSANRSNWPCEFIIGRRDSWQVPNRSALARLVLFSLIISE